MPHERENIPTPTARRKNGFFGKKGTEKQLGRPYLDGEAAGGIPVVRRKLVSVRGQPGVGGRDVEAVDAGGGAVGRVLGHGVSVVRVRVRVVVAEGVVVRGRGDHGSGGGLCSQVHGCLLNDRARIGR